MIQIYIIHHIFCVNVRAPLYTIAILCYVWKLHGITMKHLWIAYESYEYDHVSPILQARSARTAEPAFLPLGEDIPGQSGRDMPREDPLKRFKDNKVRSTKKDQRCFMMFLFPIWNLCVCFQNLSNRTLNWILRDSQEQYSKGTYCRLHTAAWCQSELEHLSLELGWWVA